MNTITIKDIVDEDFINYKKPSMFIATSKCTFKCEKEDCKVKCQNSKIVKQPNIKIDINVLINRYLNNQITKSIVFGGLEPLDQINELVEFIKEFRKNSSDDIVIYTGYTESEVKSFKYNHVSYLDLLLNANNPTFENNEQHNQLIIKFGRFKSSGDEKYDNVLGITLASSNQYAKIYN